MGPLKYACRCGCGRLTFGDYVTGHRPVVPIEERFWSKVDKSGDCWIWRGAYMNTGYGHFWHAGRYRMASHIAWELNGGGSVAGQFLCHVCDNPKCVRPDHLFVGHHLENQRDAFRKGRHSVQRYRAKHPFCPKGHPFTPENTGFQNADGYRARYCRICMRAKVRRFEKTTSRRNHHRRLGTAVAPPSK